MPSPMASSAMRNIDEQQGLFRGAGGYVYRHEDDGIRIVNDPTGRADGLLVKPGDQHYKAIAEEMGVIRPPETSEIAGAGPAMSGTQMENPYTGLYGTPAGDPFKGGGPEPGSTVTGGDTYADIRNKARPEGGTQRADLASRPGPSKPAPGSTVTGGATYADMRRAARPEGGTTRVDLASRPKPGPPEPGSTVTGGDTYADMERAARPDGGTQRVDLADRSQDGAPDSPSPDSRVTTYAELKQAAQPKPGQRKVNLREAMAEAERRKSM